MCMNYPKCVIMALRDQYFQSQIQHYIKKYPQKNAYVSYRSEKNTFAAPKV